MNEFPCSGCGSCCKRIDKSADAMQALGLEPFPYSWDETGRCEMLGIDNKCKVCDNRPEICSVDAMRKYFINLSEKEYFNLNINACNTMMDEDGIDSEFRLKLI